MFADRISTEVPDYVIEDLIREAVKRTVFQSVFPRVHIASAERTGVTIFNPELNFARNKLLDYLCDKSKEITPYELLERAKSDYPLPVNDNVNYVRSLASTSKDDSFLVERYPHLIDSFSNILGGDYNTAERGETFFIPASSPIKGTRQ